MFVLVEGHGFLALSAVTRQQLIFLDTSFKDS